MELTVVGHRTRALTGGNQQHIPLNASTGQGVSRGFLPNPLLEATSMSALKTSKDGGPSISLVHLSMWMSFSLPSASSRMEAHAQHRDLGAQVFRETHAWHELMDLGSEQPIQSPPPLPTDGLWEKTATSMSSHSPGGFGATSSISSVSQDHVCSPSTEFGSTHTSQVPPGQTPEFIMRQDTVASSPGQNHLALSRHIPGFPNPHRENPQCSLPSVNTQLGQFITKK